MKEPREKEQKTRKAWQGTAQCAAMSQKGRERKKREEKRREELGLVHDQHFSSLQLKEAAALTAQANER